MDISRLVILKELISPASYCPLRLDQITVDRIVDGRKVVLLDREDENVQVVVDAKDFTQVNEGDIVQVTWTGEVGGASYTIKLEDETAATRDRIRSKLDRLKNRNN